jgi:cytochrome c
MRPCPLDRAADAGRRKRGAGLRRLIAAAVVCYGFVDAFAQDDSARGERLYVERCGGCHSLDEHGAGPRHRGLIGRRAGSEPGFDYSPALTAAKIVWSAELLDRWVANPNALVPGNRMVVQLASDPSDRAAIVAYLVSQRR